MTDGGEHSGNVSCHTQNSPAASLNKYLREIWQAVFVCLCDCDTNVVCVRVCVCVYVCLWEMGVNNGTYGWHGHAIFSLHTKDEVSFEQSHLKVSTVFNIQITTYGAHTPDT